MRDIQQEQDLELLDLIQENLEEDIYNFAIERTEDLYDEDEDQLVRALFWSVGTSVYGVVVTPMGNIKSIFQVEPKEEAEEFGLFPSDLMVQVFNSILDLTHRCYETEE